MGIIRIISNEQRQFLDRREAGQLLAEELVDLRGENAIVVGIPRGGVLVAQQLAHLLEGRLDVILSRKLGTPGQRELAMGAVSEDGKVFLNEYVIKTLGVEESTIKQEVAVQLREISRRREFIRQVRPQIPLEGRVVIVTDDGVATGATAQAALWSVRQENPRKVVAAFPVGSEEAVTRLALDADEMICLDAPPFFAAVGQFYLKFDQLEDEDVLEILKEENRRERDKSGRQGLTDKP